MNRQALREQLDANVHPVRWVVFLLLLVMVRGLFVLSVKPAFEGWDEYQHLAYIDFLDAHGHMPRIGDSVDASFVAAVVKYPEPPLGGAALRASGGVDYTQFWHGATPERTPGARVALYEAQHPPGYYWCMIPIYRAMGGRRNLVAIAYVLDGINLLVTVAAAAVFCAVIYWLFEGKSAWRWGAALLAVHPLFLLTGVRVANDAASMLMAAVALLLTVFLMQQMRGAAAWRWWVPAGLGASLGLAMWTKQTVLALLPVVAIVACVSGWGKTALRRRLGVMGLIAGLFLVTGGVVLGWNVQQYHALVPLYEAAHFAGPRPGISSYVAAVIGITWWRELWRWWLGDSIWVGGWSYFLAMPWLQPLLFEPGMLVGLAGAMWCAVRRVEVRRNVWLAVGVCGCFTLALAVHAVQTKVYKGTVMTTPWYAVAAWPMELFLVALGLRCLPRIWGKVVMAVVMGACVWQEWHGTLYTMVKGYAGGVGGEWVSLGRVARLHGGVVGPQAVVGLAVLQLLMGSVLIVTIAATGEGPSG
ncbi:MAG: glycosyltransferase family 39 protein [Phycisphaerae bacterium]